MTEPNRACLTYWAPILEAVGVPTPRTEIVRWPGDPLGLVHLLDGKTPDGYGGFLVQLREAAERISPTGPWFLRTGQGSGKHQWKDTCHVTDLNKLGEHVAALVEWSHCVDFFGLPHDVWAVREMLPTKPVAYLPRHGGMPLVRELRGFVVDGHPVCQHSYWLRGAVMAGFRELPRDFGNIYAAVSEFDADELREIESLLKAVAAAFMGDGAWSVDVLDTERGFFITDMAPAERSYHFPGCAIARRRGWPSGEGE